MSKFRTIDVWNKYYGNTEELVDYTGRIIRKSACNNPNSRYFPTIDHIRPLSKGGKDIIGNITLCHRETNEIKGDHFPHWKIDDVTYKAIKIPNTQGEYDIAEEDY